MARNPHVRLAVGAICLILAAISTASAEWNEKVLYSFQGGVDGYTPAGGVVFDKAGNLYGANTLGGSGGCPSPGCGTVFELSPPTQNGGSWTETTIYAFQGVLGSVKDGLTPESGIIIDQQGNLYGTTTLGGNGPCILLGSPAGCGIVYELSPPAQKGGAWTETILYNFQGGDDGYFPIGNLVFDKHGNLYGSTWYGGGRGTNCDPYYGGNCGTVFELSTPKQRGGTWTEKVLHSFAGIGNGKQSGDSANPNGGLTVSAEGSLYGTSIHGGYNCTHNSDQGCGTVFELRPPKKQGGAWTETQIHVFKNGDDGGEPTAGVIFGAGGSLYGGAGGGAKGGGVVFRESIANGHWHETILYEFTSGSYGYEPSVSLFDKTGALYGTTFAVPGPYSGSVFRLKPPAEQGGVWNMDFLYRFKGAPDGIHPNSPLTRNKAGDLYGTTQSGGTGACYPAGCGTVFEVSR